MGIHGRQATCGWCRSVFWSRVFEIVMYFINKWIRLNSVNVIRVGVGSPSKLGFIGDYFRFLSRIVCKLFFNYPLFYFLKHLQWTLYNGQTFLSRKTSDILSCLFRNIGSTYFFISFCWAPHSGEITLVLG